MCAIAGIVRYYGLELDGNMTSSMCDNMYLRGPDSGNVYSDGSVALGHRRLSIIDLTTGNQPMISNDGNVVIVFNGEVYNFRDIRNKLCQYYDFKTESDTEVVIAAYQYFGLEKMLSELEGMYAFAIYDKSENVVYVVRDKFGEKPLYYINSSESFIFASELKAFDKEYLKKIDKSALNLFMSLGYIPAPYTIFEEVRKLEAGTYAKIEKDNFSIHEYFSVFNEISNVSSSMSFDEAKVQLRRLLENSVRKRLVADVEVGAFLSGGIDSSIVCCLMQRLTDKQIHTFSIGFNEKDYDERGRARIVAEHIKSNHTEFILDYKSVFKELDNIVLYYDEPFADSSAIPSYYVAKLAKDKVKVVLTGDCADELFVGYSKYLAKYYSDKYCAYPKFFRNIFEKIVKVIPHNSFTNRPLRKIKKVVSNSKFDDYSRYFNLMCLGYNDIERGKLLKSDFYVDINSFVRNRYNKASNCSRLQREQICDIKTVLEGDMFPKVDRACMHNSLENRAPFIDSSIVKFALNIPDEFKLKGVSGKFILKETFKDILPKEIFNLSKKGFEVPVDYWMRNELKQEMYSFMEKDFIEKQGFFDFKYINDIFNEHLNKVENHKGKLWNFYVFQKWYLSYYLPNDGDFVK